MNERIDAYRQKLRPVPTQDEFAALIIAVGEGDRAAFRRLYLGTSAKLLGIVTRIIKSRPEAEEVVQEVYMRVWTSAKTFSPETGAAMGWLISIARNRAIDVIRSRASAATENYSGEWFDALADPQNTEADLMNRKALVDCLGKLDKPLREMIVLAYSEGLSREELAVRFDAPVNTIKTRLHRGLASLKSCLDDAP